MTDLQLYLAIGVPTLAVLVGMFVNIGYFVTINGRLSGMEMRLDGRINSIEAKFDLLTGKVIEVDNRLTRIEEQLKH
jgi:hypothetical protein